MAAAGRAACPARSPATPCSSHRGRVSASVDRAARDSIAAGGVTALRSLPWRPEWANSAADTSLSMLRGMVVRHDSAALRMRRSVNHRPVRSRGRTLPHGMRKACVPEPPGVPCAARHSGASHVALRRGFWGMFHEKNRLSRHVTVHRVGTGDRRHHPGGRRDVSSTAGHVIWEALNKYAYTPWGKCLELKFRTGLNGAKLVTRNC